jgi:hypothetical protein
MQSKALLLPGWLSRSFAHSVKRISWVEISGTGPSSVIIRQNFFSTVIFSVDSALLLTYK